MSTMQPTALRALLTRAVPASSSTTTSTSPTGNDRLPVTIDMLDHGQVEQTGPLPSALSLEGKPDGADPDVGDLGQLESDAPQRISELDGPVTARVEVHRG
jgi:hypothetical protein